MGENLDVFFDGLDSVKAIFTVGYAQKPVIGFFDNGYFDTSVGDVVVDTTQPRFTCKSKDLIGVNRGSTVYIKDKKYTLAQIQDEGTGTSTVILAHED